MREEYHIHRVTKLNRNYEFPYINRMSDRRFSFNWWSWPRVDFFPTKLKVQGVYCDIVICLVFNYTIAVGTFNSFQLNVTLNLSLQNPKQGLSDDDQHTRNLLLYPVILNSRNFVPILLWWIEYRNNLFDLLYKIYHFYDTWCFVIFKQPIYNTRRVTSFCLL